MLCLWLSLVCLRSVVHCWWFLFFFISLFTKALSCRKRWDGEGKRSNININSNSIDNNYNCICAYAVCIQTIKWKTIKSESYEWHFIRCELIAASLECSARKLMLKLLCNCERAQKNKEKRKNNKSNRLNRLSACAHTHTHMPNNRFNSISRWVFARVREWN